MGATLCGEVQEEKNEEELEEWLIYSSGSLHIKYKKRDMTNVEKCDINITVGNDQNMKCKLKGSVNVKLKDVKTVKLTEFLYIPQAVKNRLSVSRIVSKGAMVGATQDKMIIKKNGVSIIVYAKKGEIIE